MGHVAGRWKKRNRKGGGGFGVKVRNHFEDLHINREAQGSAVEALLYKPGDRGFDSRRCQWNFSLT
jgi:hypothetical protein